MEDARISETERTFVSIRVERMNSDRNDWSGIFQSCLGKMDFRFVGGWTSLGEFELVESEDFAYRNVSLVNGYGIRGAFGILFNWNSWKFGLCGGAENVSIGGELYREFSFAASARIDWDSGFGSFTGIAGWERETPCFSLEYDLNGHIRKAGFGIGVFGEWNINGIVGFRASVRNFRDDLRFGVVFRYGLVYPVYRILTLEAEKSFGQFRISVSVVPSMLENTLFSLNLTWYLNIDKTDNGAEI